MALPGGKGGTVSIEGLNEFRAAVRQAAGAYPRVIGSAIKKAGVPITAQAASMVPHRTGTLSAGYKVSVAGTTGRIVSSVPYAGGAEWGRMGKWSGFNQYGAAPRFAGAALDQQETAVQLIIENELGEIMTMYGWAH